ncbi:hypothetical protein [Nostoc sp.]
MNRIAVARSKFLRTFRHQLHVMALMCNLGENSSVISKSTLDAIATDSS